jgi:hypothetical protein
MINTILHVIALGISVTGAREATRAAWSLNVHAVVCEIAWQHLDDATKQFVRDVRRADPDAGPTFSGSCAWADTVRNTTHRATYQYHFINVDRGSPAIDWPRDCGAYDCVTAAVVRYARYLAETPRSRADSLRRADALKFLGHFVGDLHQPMHAGFRDDLGGNLTAVQWGGANPNLHAVWDGFLPGRAQTTTVADGVRLAGEVTDEERLAWRNVDVLGWTAESYQVTATQAYDFGTDPDLSGSYATRMSPIVVERLKQAGVRLAWLIQHAASGTLALPRIP